MRRGSLALFFLSLYTTTQRASEIEGDLIETSAYRGRSWFITHVVGTTFRLFIESYKRAPFRITALSIAATGVSVLSCGLIDQAFVASDAQFPAPAIAFLVIPAAAFLTGLWLGYFGSGLGIRAATCTTVLLTFLLVITQVLPRAAQFSNNTELGMLDVALNVTLLGLSSFVLSVATFLAPLMMGSIYGHDRLAS
jgi:hypothetical protein